MLSQVVYSKNGRSEAFQLLSKAEGFKGSMLTLESEKVLKKRKMNNLLIGESELEYDYLHSCDRCGKRLNGLEPLVLGHETGLCIPCDKELEKDVEARRRLPKLIQLKLNSML